jgi:hypothetical protein
VGQYGPLTEGVGLILVRLRIRSTVIARIGGIVITKITISEIATVITQIGHRD